MKDILKSFLMGVGAATGFFLAISFTSDAEDMASEAAQVEYTGYLAGLRDGAYQATLNKQCGWRDAFREPVRGAM